VKVGIITFQRADNYGAVLQCYALYKIIDELGYDVEVIDYRNPNIERDYTGVPQWRINFIKWIFRAGCRILYRKRHKLFDDFRKEIRFSDSCYEKDIMKNGLSYDIIIVGSDQMWNPLIAKELNNVYLLDFPGNFIKCAYAVSLGNADNDVFKTKKFIDKVRRFHELSFREQSGVDLVSKMVEVEVRCCLDPTFLISKMQWDEIADNTDINIGENYILFYQAENNSDLVKIAGFIADKLKLPIIGCTQYPPKARKIRWIKEIGPKEFINLIRGADIVVTSSFHASAFSVIYGKELYILLHKKTGGRLKSLADLCEINSRIYSSYKDFIDRYDPEEKIKYKYDYLQEKRIESMEFLHKVLKNM